MMLFVVSEAVLALRSRIKSRTLIPMGQVSELSAFSLSATGILILKDNERIASGSAPRLSRLNASTSSVSNREATDEATCSAVTLFSNPDKCSQVRFVVDVCLAAISSGADEQVLVPATGFGNEVAIAVVVLFVVTGSEMMTTLLFILFGGRLSSICDMRDISA